MDSCERGCCPSPKEHYRSLRFVAKGEGTLHERDRQFQRDREAYRRLRQNGLQPPRIDGCAVVEQYATTKEEVEHGAVVWKKG